LVEVPIIVFQKNSHVQATTIVTSFQNEHVVKTTEEPKPIRKGAELTIVSCTLPLPIKFGGVLVVVVNTQVKALEEPIIPKPIPLVIPKNGIGVEVILIDNIAHAFEVLKTLDKVLKDTLVDEGPRFQPIPLVELVDTIGEQHVDDLAVGVKHVVLCD
jgi:hypothetical protein